METTISKNKQGYGYKYTDLAQIHEYLESNDLRYYQFIKKIENDDYIMTQKIVKNGDNWELDGDALQGCRVVQATLSGKSNPAQEQGSALTYARRYSLLMAYGLATDDDDAQSLTKKLITKEQLSVLQRLVKAMPNASDYYKLLLETYKVKDLSQLKETDFMEIMKDIKGEQ